jgi:alkylation response protein AidB-like acyl-CoA dehydrogenase
VRVDAERDGDALVLRGASKHVLDGHTATWIIVSTGDDLALVRGDAPGLTRRATATMDATRRSAELHFDGVRARSLGTHDAHATLATALDRARVLLAAEQVGGAERCLEMSVDYAKTRQQFGRPIGSFQAIKHKLADVFVRVESARSAAYYAAWVAATRPAELATAAAMAKASASEAYFLAASESIQVHGGIGFTWEHDAHLLFKRARASEALFGDPSVHRERIARALLDSVSAR